MRWLALALWVLTFACARGADPTPPPVMPTPPAAITATSVCPRTTETPDRHPVDEVARKIVTLFNARDAAAIFALFNAKMRAAVPRDTTETILAGLHSQKGRILANRKIEGESNERLAVYEVDAERGKWRMLLALDDAGSVSGLRFTDPDAPEPDVARSTIPLALPFKGRWRVFWGGP